MGHPSSISRAERSPARSWLLGHAVRGMTSRTTPVGILVIALAGFIAIGCSAPTAAVFQALLDPAGTAVSSPEADPAADGAADDSAPAQWWPHPDGYAMVLPAGWSVVAVEDGQSEELIAAAAAAMPGLGGRISDVLDGTQTTISAVAVSGAAEAAVPPMMLVLVQPTDGQKAHAMKTEVRERISALPGLSSPLSAHDVALPSARGVRFDYTIDDPDLGELRVFSYLFRFGMHAYLVNFVTTTDLTSETEAVFDSIAASLRFGV